MKLRGADVNLDVIFKTLGSLESNSSVFRGRDEILHGRRSLKPGVYVLGLEIHKI